MQLRLSFIPHLIYQCLVWVFWSTFITDTWIESIKTSHDQIRNWIQKEPWTITQQYLAFFGKIGIHELRIVNMLIFSWQTVKSFITEIMFQNFVFYGAIDELSRMELLSSFRKRSRLRFYFYKIEWIIMKLLDFSTC